DPSECSYSHRCWDENPIPGSSGRSLQLERGTVGRDLVVEHAPYLGYLPLEMTGRAHVVHCGFPSKSGIGCNQRDRGLGVCHLLLGDVCHLIEDGMCRITIRLAEESLTQLPPLLDMDRRVHGMQDELPQAEHPSGLIALAVRCMGDGPLHLVDPLSPSLGHGRQDADFGGDANRSWGLKGPRTNICPVLNVEDHVTEHGVACDREGGDALEYQWIGWADAEGTVLILVGGDVVVDGLAPRAPGGERERRPIVSEVAPGDGLAGFLGGWARRPVARLCELADERRPPAVVVALHQ